MEFESIVKPGAVKCCHLGASWQVYRQIAYCSRSCTTDGAEPCAECQGKIRCGNGLLSCGILEFHFYGCGLICLF